jgi:hypothetical protein
MPAKDISRIRWRLLWNMHQVHVCFFHFAATLVMIAWRTGCHQICPLMLPAHVTWDHMIDCQIDFAPAAILTGIIVTSEYFAAR